MESIAPYCKDMKTPRRDLLNVKQTLTSACVPPRLPPGQLVLISDFVDFRGSGDVNFWGSREVFRAWISARGLSEILFESGGEVLARVDPTGESDVCDGAILIMPQCALDLFEAALVRYSTAPKSDVVDAGRLVPVKRDAGMIPVHECHKPDPPPTQATAPPHSRLANPHPFAQIPTHSPRV